MGPGVRVTVTTCVRVDCGGRVGIVVTRVVTGTAVAGPPEGPDIMFATITSPAKMGRIAIMRITIAR